jgi:hypothetical protein
MPESHGNRGSLFSTTASFIVIIVNIVIIAVLAAAIICSADLDLDLVPAPRAG